MASAQRSMTAWPPRSGGSGSALICLERAPDITSAVAVAALLETNTVAILELLKQHKAAPVLGEAAAAFIASVKLLSPSPLSLPSPLTPLLKELQENFNSAVTRDSAGCSRVRPRATSQISTPF